MITGKTVQLQCDGGAYAASRDMRVEKELSRLSLDSMLATVLVNAPGVAAIGFVLVLGGAWCGNLSIGDVAVASGAQCVGAVAAFFAYRRRQRLLASERSLLPLLVGLQALIAVCWGGSFLAYWRNGIPGNNLAVGMVLFIEMWAVVFSRSSHMEVFLTGIFVPALMCLLLFALSDGRIAHLLACIIPLWSIYMLSMGRAANRWLRELLSLRFANEDLAVALAGARDEAVEQKRELERANKAKSAFLANMSHELRTPLNAILGFSEIIAQRLFDRDPARNASYAQDIHDSGTHLLSLINDLLDISKIEAGRMEIDPCPLDAAEAMNEVERLIRGRVEAKRQTLTVSAAENVPPLYADGRAFKQIALNLLSNAVKYTPEGGHIDVTCGAAPGGGFLFSVMDDGPGIPRNMLDKVFQPFSQIDNRYGRQEGGTGLGLALVRGLAELHGGNAWVESEYGKGCRACVYLPLIQPQADARRNL